MYQVFNPIQGQYEQAETLDDAKSLFTKTVHEYFVYANLFQSLPTNNYYKENQTYANEFVAINCGESETTYLYSVYNATNKEVISQVFSYSDGLVKVTNKKVTEWYKANYKLNGNIYAYVSVSLETEQPLEYYVFVENENVFNKHNINGEFIVSTNFTQVPQDRISLLTNFEYKDTIMAWSDKSYGFCVEYLGKVNIPYNECTVEQQEHLDTQKQEFITLNSNIFSVNQEMSNENGDTTWIPTEIHKTIVVS